MMRRLEVHKFGGTSVGGTARLAATAALLRDAARRTDLIVVSSAMSGITNLLVAAAESAEAGDQASVLEAIIRLREAHQTAASGLGVDLLATGILELIDETAASLSAMATLKECSLRAKDPVIGVGEKLAVRLLAAAMRGLGIPAVPVDADGFLETDDHHGEANPLHGITARAIEIALAPYRERGEVPVVTGFLGRAPDGRTTTLGRGGSDYTATLIAAATAADEVVIWTDVHGVYTADPRLVEEARPVPQLNFREAAELSFYGAKVLHQRTILPIANQRIPVRIRNAQDKDGPETLIDGRFTPGSHPVKAISAIRNQALISLEGRGLVGVPGVAKRLFGALAERSISVTMISQSSSESSICLAVPATEASEAELALKREFRQDTAAGLVEDVFVRQPVGLVAAVGLGMAHKPGVGARVLGALGNAGVNILAIAQGSSELNISLAIDDAEVPVAVRALHADLGLHRRDTGHVDERQVDLLLVGFGNIGRSLAKLIDGRRALIRERFGLAPKIVGIADRGGYVFRPRGLDDGDLAAAVLAKTLGRSVATLSEGVATNSVADLVSEACQWRLTRPILVDVSDDEHGGAAWIQALEAGCDVVTANKGPLAGPEEHHQAIHGAATRNRRLLRYEATVGAGLPVMETLDMLLQTGDALSMAEGCLSGTLAFVMGAMEAGQSFPDAVDEAVRRGYTEPDPAIDLTGVDVARKAIIIGRKALLLPQGEVPELEGLVPQTFRGLPAEDLRQRLRELDGALRRRIEEARGRGHVLRYVARVESGRAIVGPMEVPANSPLGQLKGTDNVIAFHSERYDERPLVIIGPGAGIDVTAMGVLADILRVVAERSQS